MSKKTSPNKEKSETEVSSTEEVNMDSLLAENQYLKNLVNLQDQSYYRQQMLLVLGRIANALEESLEEEQQEEESEEDESEEKE